jgi:hypothetical protein
MQPHAAEILCAPKLGSAEDDMQNRRNYLERQSPTVPQRAEEPHDGYGFDDSAGEGGDAGKAEDFAQVVVVGRVYAVQDDGDMWPELGNDVEDACRVGLG